MDHDQYRVVPRYWFVKMYGSSLLRLTGNGLSVQAFLDFRGFDFRNFGFNVIYNSILFSSPLVLLSNLDLRGFCFPGFFMCPHINSVNRGMPHSEDLPTYC
jgi:hypothetical protein